MEVCFGEKPPLFPVGFKGHEAACYLYEEGVPE
jgi:hypothetical protein